MVEPYKPLYTVKEASEILMVNADTVRDFIKKGKIKALKLGAMKIRGTDLEAFIESYEPVQNGAQS